MAISRSLQRLARADDFRSPIPETLCYLKLGLFYTLAMMTLMTPFLPTLLRLPKDHRRSKGRGKHAMRLRGGQPDV